MASIAKITPASNSVTCDAEGLGTHLFTVENISDGVLRYGIALQVDDPCRESWLRIEGDAERILAEKATDQIEVNIRAPAEALPGGYRFRLLIYSIADPGEDFTESDIVELRVKPMAQPITMAKKEKQFRWWIPITISAFFVVVGLLAIKYGDDGEAAAWEKAKIADTIESYTDFVSEYPNGEFISQANTILQDLNEHPGGILKVFCEAGYVATFNASWDQLQANGSYVRKTWSSGRIAVGQRASVQIPPRSRNVVLSATGDVVGKIFEKSRPAFGREYKVYGTILKSGWTEQ